MKNITPGILIEWVIGALGQIEVFFYYLISQDPTS